MDTLYYNEHPCTARTKAGKKCVNNAYYFPQLCGVHNKDEGREKLPINPNAKVNREKKLEKHRKGVESAAKENRDNGLCGMIINTRMRMMKDVPLYKGYLNVFPNYRHGNRKDGIGMPTLSPFNLGPVEHDEPDFPPAQCIENYHQFSKVFSHEVDKKGNVRDEFFKLRRKMFKCPDGERHKVKGEVPLFAVYTDSEGREDRYSYIGSKQFYCRAYESLAKKEKEYKRLRKLIDDGYNINLCGYDANDDVDSEMEDLASIISDKYHDEEAIFGHELVLFTLLTLDPDKYPWPKERTNGDVG